MASHTLSLGGLNKTTDKYVYPKIANKADQYVCPDCTKDLTLCQGEIRIPYFRHKIDAINPCNHYSSPSESQIHKDAKLLLKELLDSKTLFTMTRLCSCCKEKDEFDIPDMTDESVVELEHRFNYNNGVKIADVAYLDKGQLVCIFEICHTHKTGRENRPEPWFEIDAQKLIAKVNDRVWDKTIPCIRRKKCEECVEKKAVFTNDKIKAVDMVYDWLNSGKEIKPFVADYCPITTIVKYTKAEFFDISADIIINMEGDGPGEDWNRYLIQLVYDSAQCFSKCNFAKGTEQEYADLHVGIYYIDINWVLAQTRVPLYIKYLACLDKYLNSTEDVKCVKCKDDTPLWVKRVESKSWSEKMQRDYTYYAITSVGCYSCRDGAGKYTMCCQRCGVKGDIWEMENNIHKTFCKTCDLACSDKLFLKAKRYGAMWDTMYKNWYVSNDMTNAKQTKNAITR